MLRVDDYDNDNKLFNFLLHFCYVIQRDW